MSADREWNESNDAPAQRDEGDDVEAHAYRSHDSHDAYRSADSHDSHDAPAARDEGDDVEGHAFNVDTVDNVD